MTHSDPGSRPAVVVHVRPGAPERVLREICAGAEEEGVPTRVVTVPGRSAGEQDGSMRSTGEHDVTALAHAAAASSRLDVGIAVDAVGAAAVHHGKLPAQRPVTTVETDATVADWRRVGRTAARIVKGLPLS
ncbi:glycerol dehydratase reactivase beta/small subunit family protein [Geodermatophilus ruber]|uniref:Glycerol dehydratase reactivation factor, small subunit n=1 Tax=Geodermatophilus ruber TaxID=504800 RepID=A0A1I4CEE1_9ACTN|nr:glycerol dehydratase reactivase beta/small subunit family protein [Geodermatophilus ruber]SFK78649.1 glycerol dehydratase reactivation factor, small subunit [Geodermatophilus ruber]